MNHVYQQPPDGLAMILAPAEGAVFGKLMDEPGARFAEAAAQVAAGTQVRVLAQGETLTIDPIGRPA